MQLTDALFGQLQERAGAFAKQAYALRLSQRGDAVDFAQLLVHYGYLDRDGAGELVAAQLGRTYVNLGKTLFQQDLVKKVPMELAKKLRAIPLYKLGNKATVGMVDPADAKAVRSLESLLESPVSAVFSFPDEIESAIEVNFQTAQDFGKLLAAFDPAPFLREEIPEPRLRELLESKQLVRLSEMLLLLALKERASDIHIEPKGAQTLVRFRIDGEMTQRMELPKAVALPLVSRYKVIASLDITERRKPHDGRFVFSLPGRKIDIRVSTLPTIHGEKVVMRVLGSLLVNVMLNLDKLNLSPELLVPLKRVLQQPNGCCSSPGRRAPARPPRSMRPSTSSTSRTSTS